tara:strand:- start:393 stop:680 length:288 start_codon:yes stop_codon:yes gene_type:complete
MSFQGKFKPYAELDTSGSKSQSDQYTCDNARFVRIIANSTSRTIVIKRPATDDDANTTVGQFLLKSIGDSCIFEKHPHDIIVYSSCSVSKVSNIA